MKRSILIALTLTLTMLFTGVLQAHDVWVVKEAGGLLVIWGHGEKRFPYQPAYVKNAKAYSASGKKVALTIKPQDTKANLIAAQTPALVTIFFNAGPWVKTPEGWKNVSKRKVKNGLQSMKMELQSKNLWQWNKRFSKPLGGKMEIVPQKNPLTLKVGDKLPLQVFYDGKPLAGAPVRAEGIGKEGLKTDSHGRAEVTIKKSGFTIIGAARKTDTPNDPDADMLYESANLTFKVK